MLNIECDAAEGRKVHRFFRGKRRIDKNVRKTENDKMGIVLLSNLEGVSLFRIDFLYFLQLSNTILGNVIFDFFSRRHRKPPRLRQARKLLRAIDSYKKAGNKLPCTERDAYRYVMTERDLLSYDVIRDIMRFLEEKAKGAILDNIQKKLFISYTNWNQFDSDWKYMIDKRNSLIHYKLHRVCDNDSGAIKAMLKILPDNIHQLLIHTVSSHYNRTKTADEGGTVEKLKEISEQIKNDKKEYKKQSAGKRLKDKLSAANRRMLQKTKEAQIKRKDSFYTDNQHKPRLSTFQNTEMCIGKRNIYAIKQQLQSRANINFDDYWAIFGICTNINLLFNRVIEKLRQKFEVSTNSNENNFRRLVTKLPDYGDSRYKSMLDDLIHIRNAIEHNGLCFCYSKGLGAGLKYSFAESLNCIFQAARKYLGAEDANNIYTGMKSIVENEKYCWVTYEGKRIKVKVWNTQNRMKYKDCKKDKRYNVQQFAAMLQQDIENEKKGK